MVVQSSDWIGPILCRVENGWELSKLPGNLAHHPMGFGFWLSGVCRWASTDAVGREQRPPEQGGLEWCSPMFSLTRYLRSQFLPLGVISLGFIIIPSIFSLSYSRF